MTTNSKIRPITYRQFPIRLDESTMAALDLLAIQTTRLRQFPPIFHPLAQVGSL